MTTSRIFFGRFAVSLFLLLAVWPAAAQRVPWIPQLHSGQIIIYRLDFSSSRSVKSESRIISPQVPPPTQLSVSALLQVEVVDANPAALRLKTYLSERSATPAAAAPSADKLVEVTISSSGSASQITGFAQLSPAQQSAWTDWLSRFTTSFSFPKSSLRVGQKWQSVEPETAQSPIAALSWNKKFQYSHDESCAPVVPQTASSAKASSQQETCAVILVRESLRQKSSPKDTTPEDYKLQNLITRGTASGQNETILFLSRSTGLLVRSSQQTQQSMDVVVALADGSNQVHYNIAAKSRSEIHLLPDSPH